jgi:outer membrane protein assembly factor BamB
MSIASSVCRLALAFVMLVFGARYANAAEPGIFRGNLERTGVFNTKALRSLDGVKWKCATGGPIRSSPVLADGTIYFGSADGYLYSVSAASGTAIWKFDAESSIQSSPAVMDGIVYFQSANGIFHALDRGTGLERWKVQAGNQRYEGGWDYFESSPAVADGAVYFGAGDGNLYCVDARSGATRWKFKTAGVVRSSPAIANGIVYFGSFDGNLYAVGAAEGSLRWKFKTRGNSYFPKGEIQSSPAVADGVVVFGSRDYYLYCLNADTGKQIWSFLHNDSWVVTSPAITGGVVYAGSSDGRFFQAVDLKTGSELWRVKTAKNVLASPSVADGVLYVGCEDGSIYAVDAHTGAEKWRYCTGDQVLSTPLIDNGVVFVGSDDGNLYALSGETSEQSHPSARKAVFWDEQIVYRWFKGHEKVRDYLVAQGYELLDSRRLYRFFKERVADKAPSVVVFAMDSIPSLVAPDPGEKCLFRQYLAAGGKIVWLGMDPMTMILDATTGQPYNYETSKMTALLGVASGGFDNGQYGARATSEGKKWGLPDWWVGGWTVDPQTVTTVLGIDEFGRAAAWVKTFGGGLGTGFVRLWGREEPINDLKMIKSAAEYGLDLNSNVGK